MDCYCIDPLYRLMSIILIIVFIVLLLFAILLLGYNFICDGHSCKIFTEACLETSEKRKVLFLLKELCDDGIWPYAYISSAILCGLLFSILPIPLGVRIFTAMFLVSFLVIYSIISFFIHHYIKPIKDYIRKYLEQHGDD